MARVIVTGGKGKRYSREGKCVEAVCGVVSGTEYYEVCVVVADSSPDGDMQGCIKITKSSSLTQVAARGLAVRLAAVFGQSPLPNGCAPLRSGELDLL